VLKITFLTFIQKKNVELNVNISFLQNAIGSTEKEEIASEISISKRKIAYKNSV